MHCPSKNAIFIVMQARLLLIWSSTYGKEPGARVCSDTGAVADITTLSQDWMSVGMNELFRLAAQARNEVTPRAYWSTSNVALLWAVKGPDFDLRGALSAAGAGPLDALQEDLSLKRLVAESDNVSSPVHRIVISFPSHD